MREVILSSASDQPGTSSLGTHAYLPTACAEGGVIETQLESEHGSSPICPTGGIVNNIVMQMLHAQFAEEMIRRGKHPLWQMGVYRIGGREFNVRNDKLFFSRGF